MKNRRSAIIVAVMVALVGTPRAWQEVNNVLAALQHKTQNKLLSMAVNSQVRENGEAELAGGVRPEHHASCPFEYASEVAENHKPVESVAHRQLKAERRAPAVSGGSSTVAANSVAKKKLEVTLPQLEEAMAWTGENQLAMHAIAAVPKELLRRENVDEFVTLPQVNPQVNPLPQINATQQAFTIRTADFIKLKKSYEDCKAVRQKVRYIISHSTPPPPATPVPAI